MASKARDVQPTGSEGLGASERAWSPRWAGSACRPDAKPLEINAIGQQWLWRFEYPGGPARRPDLLLRRARGPRRHHGVLHVTSTDVMHRWFVPALGGQVDAVPGDTTPRPGSGPIARASTRASRPSSPGPRYPAMRAWVRVVSARATSSSSSRSEATSPRPRGTCSRRSPRSAHPGAARHDPADDVAPRPPRDRHRGVPRRRPGWIERATSADHKSVGLLYIGTALVLPGRWRWSSSC